MGNSEKHEILEGVTLKDILEYLVNSLGFKELGKRTGARCFLFDPNINSSLKFLRKNQKERVKVENLYVELRTEK